LNPRNILDSFLGLTNTSRYLLNGSAEYDLIDGLTAKVNVGYDYSDGVATSAASSNYNNSGRISGNGQASRNSLETTNKLFDFTLNYKKDVSDDLNLDLLVAYSYQGFDREGYNSQAWGLGTTDLNAMNQALESSIDETNNRLAGLNFGPSANDQNGSQVLGFPIGTTFDVPLESDYRSFWYNRFENFPEELQSYFGRAQLNFKDKFLLTATVRRDGSTKFGANNRYGTFPSGAFAWKISEEDFVGDNVSTLKLRLSAGKTGNESGLAPADAFFIQSYAQPGINNDGSIAIGGIDVSSSQNDDLKWESTLDYNVGLDFGFNNDRLRGSIDVYRKETSDLLFLQPAAAPADQPIKFTNLEEGIVVNQGLEFAIGYDFIQTEDVGLSVDLNVAYNDNVVENTQDGFFADLGPLNGPGLTGAFAQRIAEGQSLFSYYMAEFDSNGFNADDKGFVGKDALPDITAGMSIGFNAGRFDANAYFTGLFGFHVYNNTANAFLNGPTFATSRNGTTDALALESQEVSTLYLEKGDFVRLQTLSVGYNYPLSGDGLFDSLRFTLSGQNVFLITDYSGLDPEVSSNTGAFANGIPSSGIDYTSFPRPRTFALGINATF